MHYQSYDAKDYPHHVPSAWVTGRTIDGHSIYGYIEKVEDIDKTVMVCVLRACCDAVGNYAWANLKDLEVLGTGKLTDTEGFILNAIDFALDTGDKEEFFKQTDALRKLRSLPVYSTVLVIGFTG